MNEEKKEYWWVILTLPKDRIWILTQRCVVTSRDVRFLEEIRPTNQSNPSELNIDTYDTGREINPEMEPESDDNDTGNPSISESRYE